MSGAGSEDKSEDSGKENKNNESKVACTTYLQRVRANGGSFSVIFTSSYTKHCYFTSFAVLVSLSLFGIHNLMISSSIVFLLILFHRLPASSTVVHSTQVYRVIKISNNASSAISLFSRSGNVVLMQSHPPSFHVYTRSFLLRFPPGAQFWWFYFIFNFSFNTKHRQNDKKNFFSVRKCFSYVEVFSRAFPLISARW